MATPPDPASSAARSGESDDPYRNAFDLAPLGMTIVSLDDRLLLVNRAFCNLLGYAEHELLGRDPRALSHPEDAEIGFDLRARALAGEGEAFRLEKRYLHKDGRTVWAMVTVSLVRSGDGTPLYTVAQIEDVRERRLAEEAVARRDAILAAVATSAELLLQVRNWEDAIGDVLRRLGEAVGADRAYILEAVLLADGSEVLRRRLEWRAAGVAPLGAGPAESFPLDTPGFELWHEELARGRVVQAHVRDFPPAARELLHGEGIASRLAVPILVDGVWWGSIGFDQRRSERVWTAAETDALRTAAGTLAAALQRKRASQALHAADLLYRSVVETVPVVTYVDRLGQASSAVYVSPQVEVVLGYTPEQWLSVPRFLHTILHPDDDWVRAGGWPEGPGPHRYEYRVHAADGRVVWILNEFVAVHDEEGRPLYAQGYLLDVTERKRAEEGLREANERLERVVQAAPVAIVLFDLEGRVQLWNPAAERIFGWRADEIIGRVLLAALPPDREDEHLELWSSALHGAKLEDFETRRLRKDGSHVDVSVSGAAVRDAEGRIVGVMAAYADVSERQRALEALQQSEQRFHAAQRMEAIGRLAGGVAHDFNNLLTAIVGYAQLLLADLDEASPLRRDVEEIARAADRAADLVEQLLAFSRRQPLQPRVCELTDAVAGLQPMLRHLIGEDAELVVDLDPETGPVSADPARLEQVIVNLVLNARDAMPNGGTLTLETRPVALAGATAHRLGLAPGAYARLRVVDTGIGMDEATKALAFEPFFTTKGPGKGTGLGLASVFGTVTQSGGAVDVESEPGLGTTFSVFLPRACGQQETAGEAGGRPAAAGSGETILLVEDEPAVRELASRLLAAAGYAVLAAAGGAEAIELAGRHAGPIHLLVTDVVMPGMSGRELADRLTALRPELGVLYMSGYAADGVFERGVSDAAASLLGKPFTPDALRRRVREKLRDRPSEPPRLRPVP